MLTCSCPEIHFTAESLSEVLAANVYTPVVATPRSLLLCTM